MAIMDHSRLQVEHVRQFIDIWDVMFTEQTRGEKQKTLLAKAYHSRLAANGVTPKQLSFLAGKVTDVCDYFPKISDILRAKTEHGQSQPLHNALQLDEVTGGGNQTAEERQLHEKKMKAIWDLLNKKITMDEAMKITTKRVKSFEA